jgi:hypothetical protein
MRDGLRPYLRALFKDAPRRARLGTVTPAYMVGIEGTSVPTVAERIASVAPHVRLVALLRDPVERAFSAHRMAVRNRFDRRSFREAVEDQLDPAALDRARHGPAETDSYVVAGEYGRMLASYLERFDRAQLHVELTADLDRDPVGVVGRVCKHVGVEPHQPGRAGERFYPGGRRRVSQEAEDDLKRYLERHVWPRMRHPAQHRNAFDFWFGLWNVEPEPAEPIDEEAAARLREHYAADAATLREATGVDAPWARG